MARYTSERLGKLLRWDISWREFWNAHIPPLDADVDEYRPDLDDIKALIDNLERRNPTIGELHDDWGMIYSGIEETYSEDEEGFEIYDELYDHIAIDFSNPTDEDGFINSPSDAMAELLDDLMDIVGNPNTYSVHVMDGIIDIPRIRKDIESIERGDYSISSWKWTDLTKLGAIGAVIYGHPSPIEEDEFEEAERMLEELCGRGVVPAMELKAFGSYGGSPLLPCNWFIARDTFSLLLQSDSVDELSKAAYSNALGNLHYYGKCNGGRPEYDRALQFFSVGAAMGIPESMYMIADMLKEGNGVPRNIAASISLLSKVFEITRKEFQECEEGMVSDYPEAALRVGEVLEERGEIYHAYRTYMEGMLAIEYGYGDDDVLDSLKSRISSIENDYPMIFAPQGEARSVNVLFYPLEQMMGKGAVKGEVVRNGDETWIRFIPLESPINIFIIIPGYSGIARHAIYNVVDAERIHILRNSSSFIFDAFTVNPAGDTENGTKATLEFKRDGKVTATIEKAFIGIMIPTDE